MTKEQIVSEARSMKAPEREALIDELRQLGDEDQLTVEQRAELGRRMEELRRGEAKLMPGDQVMAEVRESLGYR